MLGLAIAVAGGCGEPRDSVADPALESRLPATAGTEAESRPRVLLVHSYHAGYPWVDAITRGVKMGLSSCDAQLELFHMDTKRRTEEEYKVEAGMRAMALVDEWQPAVVITADDNAQQFFARKYVDRDGPQFIFCGVNAEPGKYGFPAANVTGILERPHFEATVEFMRQLVPDVNRVAVMSDNSPTSRAAIEYLQGRTPNFEVIGWATPTTFAEWKTTVRDVQGEADALFVYTYHTVKKGVDGERVEPRRVMQWTSENSTLPVLGCLTFAIDDGGLCGYAESGAEHGRRAGEIAAELLAGKRAGEIPIVTALDGQSMINLTVADRLGLSIDEEFLGGVDIVMGESTSIGK